MSEHRVKPTHRAIKAYHESLDRFDSEGITHEGGTRVAFHNLVEGTRPAGWLLIDELPSRVASGNIFPDGTLRDGNGLSRGYWEAKDTADDLEVEIRKKIASGYPTTNIIFEDTRRAVLYQGGKRTDPFSLLKVEDVADLLTQFFSYSEPQIERFEVAVAEFKTRVPDLARGLVDKIREAHRGNKDFISAFGSFLALCRASLNPNLSEAAVDEMLVQHLLTERLFRTVFANDEFTRRNVIAAEVEKVIDKLVSRSFNKAEFLKSLDRFYLAIEAAAATLTDFTEKQHFLNAVYERFFQGYSVKVADTHGIVYTPQPIVDFMCASVVSILEKDFGLSLGSEGVQVLDPCTGTGNFIVNLLRRLPGPELAKAYRAQFFANEVMLLPYYIASLNIEHAYYELTGAYAPFEGLCFVDTLDLAEMNRTISYLAEVNTDRVVRERAAPITVIIGNPPYNVGQVNENDNNKNRKYPVVDGRIHNTYAKSSVATLGTKLYDPYVRFFRFAVDRLGDRDGIVCLVTNNSFFDQVAFDGMRKHFAQDFQRLYHLDLGGNVRKNPKLSGTKHNVFGIQVGVGITIAVKLASETGFQLRYASVPSEWTRYEKLEYLAGLGGHEAIEWRSLEPDGQHNWLRTNRADEWEAFLPIGSKETKASRAPDGLGAIFKTFSLGVSTNRDETAYGFSVGEVERRAHEFFEVYGDEVARYERRGRPADLDAFLDPPKLKWSRNLKRSLRNRDKAEFDSAHIRRSLYRPYVSKVLYFADIVVDELGQIPSFFPGQAAERENRAICLSAVAGERPFYAVAVSTIPNLNFVGFGGGGQLFPFYVYGPDGVSRRENITDWGLARVRAHYDDGAITKADIFDYIYGLLHHSGYRFAFADSLKRSFPRIPFAPDFEAFRAAGASLSALHLGYEAAKPFPLKQVVDTSVPFSWRVPDRMRLSKDRTSLQVNPSLRLAEIPPGAFDYRLGNRSALEWIVDQYQVRRDAGGNAVSDPNREDDEEYIVRLVGRIITVSLETQRIVAGLPAAFC
jgi:predicted helicase